MKYWKKVPLMSTFIEKEESHVLCIFCSTFYKMKSDGGLADLYVDGI